MFNLTYLSFLFNLCFLSIFNNKYRFSTYFHNIYLYTFEKSMDSLKSVPRRLYFFIGFVVEMVMLFVLSIIYMTKPSDSLTREDIDHIRHKRKPSQNGNNYNYKGKRSDNRFYMGGGG